MCEKYGEFPLIFDYHIYAATSSGMGKMKKSFLKWLRNNDARCERLEKFSENG